MVLEVEVGPTFAAVEGVTGEATCEKGFNSVEEASTAVGRGGSFTPGAVGGAEKSTVVVTVVAIGGEVWLKISNAVASFFTTTGRGWT